MDVDVGHAPYGLAFHPTQPRLYVSARLGQTVTEVDIRTNSIIGNFAVGGRPHDLAVSPDGTKLYVGNEYSGVDVWGLASHTLVVSLPIGPANGLAMSPDGEQLYVSLSLQGSVKVIDISTLEVVHSFPVGGIPREIAFSPAGDMAFIANEGGGSMTGGVIVVR